MKKIKPRFKSLLLLTIAMAVLLLTGCPVAPPTEPMDQYQPYLTPKAVTSLVATNGYDNEITLTWEASPNATGYQIWWIEASNYGAVTNSGNGNYSYEKLQGRGFKFMDVTSDTSYSIKGLPHNKAYVFSVIAMRSIGTENNKSVLYSDVGTFYEGSTVGDITFTAVPLTDEVVVSWQVSNLYSVLPTVPGTKEALFDDYDFTISYRRQDETEYAQIPSAKIGKDLYYRMSMMEYGLQLNTDYVFKVSMNVYENGNKITSVDSFEFPVITTSNFSILPVESISASAGTGKDQIQVSWVAPVIPFGISYPNYFEIRRAAYDADPAHVDWSAAEVILSFEDFKALGLEVPADRTYTWSDTTAKENTRYLYGIVNAYEINEVITQQKADKPITATTAPAYTIWRPGTAELKSFTKDTSDANPLNGVVHFEWNLEEVPAAGASWKLKVTEWNGNTFVEDVKTVDVAPSYSNGVFTLDYPVSVTEADVNDHVTVFTFSLLYSYGDLTDFEVPINKNDISVSLGRTTRIALFDEASFKASNNLVGQIVLEWDVNSFAEGTLVENQYYLWVDDADPVEITPTESSGNHRKYVIEDVTGKHMYRLKLNGTYASDVPAYDYASANMIPGSDLAVPAAPSVTDSISREMMTITWEVPPADINYEIQFREKGVEDTVPWNVLEGYDKSAGTFDIMLGDLHAGAIYEFRMRAANSIMPDKFTAWSAIEEGSIFGAYGMNVRIVNDGMDPKMINIAWNPVLNADYYKVLRDGTALPGQVRDKSEYSDKSIIGIGPDASNPVPLSKAYTYTVIPYMSADEVIETPMVSNEATGRLFAPPANIRASKGEYQGKVMVTWDPVPNAEYYIIKPYSAEGTSMGATQNVYGTEYEDTISAEPVYYTVKAVTGKGTVTSEYQNSFESELNDIHEEEQVNFGYMLSTPAGFIVEEALIDGKYADYISLRWKRSLGADAYWISSSAQGKGFDLDVSMLDYASGDIVTNGKSPDEAGYLAFDKTKNEYTYNDNSGILKSSTFITGYSIGAKSSITKIVTGAIGSNTHVHRQLKPVEIVNIANTIMNSVIGKADDDFKNDWWIDNAFAWKNPSNVWNGVENLKGAIITRQTYGITASFPTDSSNNIVFDKFVFASERDTLNVNTSTPIVFWVDDASNLGKNTLHSIGRNGNGVLVLTDPSGKFNEMRVNYKDVTSVADTGSYIVNGNITVNDSNDIVRPF